MTRINLTRRALEYFMMYVGKSDNHIFIDVTKQGCGNFGYDMYERPNVKLTDSHEKIYERNGVLIVTDKKHCEYIKNLTLDFITNPPMGNYVTYDNPNAKEVCGCGKSFTIEGE